MIYVRTYNLIAHLYIREHSLIMIRGTIYLRGYSNQQAIHRRFGEFSKIVAIGEKQMNVFASSKCETLKRYAKNPKVRFDLVAANSVINLFICFFSKFYKTYLQNAHVHMVHKFVSSTTICTAVRILSASRKHCRCYRIVDQIQCARICADRD